MRHRNIVITSSNWRKRGYIRRYIVPPCHQGFFMIQAGDPESKNAPKGKMLGAGDVGYTIPAEFVYPKYFHKKGALSAARQGDNVNPKKESSGCQFLHCDG